jgi:hypothetical protein
MCVRSDGERKDVRRLKGDFGALGGRRVGEGEGWSGKGLRNCNEGVETVEFVVESVRSRGGMIADKWEERVFVGGERGGETGMAGWWASSSSAVKRDDPE